MIFAEKIARLTADIATEETRLKSAGIRFPANPDRGGGLFAARITSLNCHLERLQAMGRPLAVAPSLPAKVHSPPAEPALAAIVRPAIGSARPAKTAANEPATARQRLAAAINLQLEKRPQNHA